MSQIVGIVRASVFSPNSNDHLIMDIVRERLLEAGHDVRLVDEVEFESHSIDADAYFSMARSEKTLTELDRKMAEGSLVVNAPDGVRNCLRKTVTRLMQDNAVPAPQCFIFEDGDDCEGRNFRFPCWVKRGDACAQQKDDVVFVRNAEELHQQFAVFRQRGIGDIVISKHLEGDIVKFYGVADSSFFYWYYPTLNGGNGKFGLEAINGPAMQYRFDVAKLQLAAERLAAVAETAVFGGDCIVDAAGNFKIIDFNDWPSFSCCAAEGGKAIARYIQERL